MSVDRESRDAAVFLLNLFRQDALHIHDLQMRWPSSSSDRALGHVRHFIDGCFGRENHPRWKPEHLPAVQEAWVRCRLFLQSDRECRWLELPGIDGREDTWSDLFAHLLLGGTLENRRFERETLARAEANIDVWPFFSEGELEEARKTDLRGLTLVDLPPMHSAPRRWPRGTLICWKGTSETLDRLRSASTGWRLERPSIDVVEQLSRHEESADSRQPLLFDVHEQGGWVVLAGNQSICESRRIQKRFLGELSAVLGRPIYLYCSADRKNLVVDRQPEDEPQGSRKQRKAGPLSSRLNEFQELLPLLGAAGTNKVALFRVKYGTLESAIIGHRKYRRNVTLGYWFLLLFYLLFLVWNYWSKLLAWLNIPG